MKVQDGSMAFVFSLVLAVLSQSTFGQISKVDLDSIETAKKELRAELLPQPESSKTELMAAVLNLERFLAPERTDNGREWLKFLDWEAFQAQLASDEPELDVLVQTQLKMRQNYRGLELFPFTQVRDKLGKYIKSRQYGIARERTIEAVQRELTVLAETLNQPVAGSDLKRQRDIGVRVNLLSDTNQAPGVIHALRSQYSFPNVRALASADFLTSKFGRVVVEPNPVNEVILGTQICGESCLTGNVFTRLIPNARGACVELCLQAQFSSDTTGYNRGVKILSHGDSPVAASETISLNENGLVANGNVAVSASLNTQILDIQHQLRIVEKIATKKAAQQKPLANSIAQGRLEHRISNRYHEQVQKQLAQANEKIGQREIPELRRLGLTRPTRTSWTSNDYLALRWTQRDEKQLAAPSVCPLPVTSTGLTIQVHQSSLINLIDPVLASRLIRSTELDDLVRQFTPDVPPALVDEAKGEEWSITMASYHPVEVSFDEGKVIFIVRVANLESGDRALNRPATIEATYRIQLDQGEIQLFREGDVSIVLSQQAGIAASSLRTLLSDKFNAVFREQLLEKPIRPLDRLPSNFPKLEIASIDCSQGWMQILLR